MNTLIKKFRLFLRQSQTRFKRYDRVYIVPTRFGLLFITLVFLSFIFSISFGHSLSYLLSVSLIVFFVFIAFLTNNYLKMMGLNLEGTNHILTQNKLTTLSFNIFCTSQTYMGKLIIMGKEFEINRPQLSILLQLEQWGVISRPELRLETTYPLSLFKAWKYLSLSSPIYSAPLPLILNGERESFDSKDAQIEIRNFIIGDSLSKINWKKSRLDKLVITQEEGGQNSGRSAVINLDGGVLEIKLTMDEIFEYAEILNFAKTYNVTLYDIKGKELSTFVVNQWLKKLLDRVEYAQ